MEGGTHGAGKELVVVVDCLEEATLEHLSTVTLPTFVCQVALQVQLLTRMLVACSYVHKRMRSGRYEDAAIWSISSPNHGQLLTRTDVCQFQ